jgi:glycosyltransferase involved in cell wall biosynthesis
MHIALVLTQSLESPSGLGRYWPVARELVKAGQRVSLIAPHHDWSPTMPRHTVQDGVDVWCTGQMHVRKVGSRKEYFSPLQLLRVSLQGAINTARLIRNVRPDVIHLGKPQPINGLAARWVLALHRDWPLFVDCDDHEAASNRTSGAWQRRILAYFEDSLPRRARAVTVNTRFTQQRVQELGVPARRIVWVPNGVDRARFGEVVQTDRAGEWPGDKLDQRRVLYLGSLELISHPIDLLLEAFRQVHQSGPKSSLLIVGGGADFDRLQAQIEACGQTAYVRLAGRVPPETAATYYQAAHVTVDPVRDDVTARARSPLKVVESLAVGTPVVAGDVGDRRWLLETHEAGLVVKADEAAALADGLLAVLGDEPLRQHLQAGALRAREKFWWDRLINDWLEVYEL